DEQHDAGWDRGVRAEANWHGLAQPWLKSSPGEGLKPKATLGTHNAEPYAYGPLAEAFYHSWHSVPPRHPLGARSASGPLVVRLRRRRRRGRPTPGQQPPR